MSGHLRRRQSPFRYRPPMFRESPTTGILESALDLHHKGLRLVPLVGKRAIIRDWPNLHLSEEDIRSWSNRRVNWGIITGDPLVVLDTDSEAAEAWVKEKRIDSPVVVQSGGRGLHRYFRRPEGAEIHSRSAVQGVAGLDLKGWRSYIVAAGSIHPQTHRRYYYLTGRHLIDLRDLPLFDPAWTRTIREGPLDKPFPHNRRVRLTGRIRDVRSYIRGIASIEGQGGDKACFTVACLLLEAGLSPEEAMLEMVAWNRTNAFPPWEPEELLRKLRYAFSRVVDPS